MPYFCGNYIVGRLVDDTFVIMQTSEVNRFCDHLNDVDSNINFTNEQEQDDQPAYLDVIVTRRQADAVKITLVVFLGKALNGMPHLCVKDRWPSFSLRREVWWQEGHPTVKQNVSKCCSDPNWGIKPLVTPFINGNKARKEKEP